MRTLLADYARLAESFGQEVSNELHATIVEVASVLQSLSRKHADQPPETD